MKMQLLWTSYLTINVKKKEQCLNQINYTRQWTSCYSRNKLHEWNNDEQFWLYKVISWVAQTLRNNEDQSLKTRVKFSIDGEIGSGTNEIKTNEGKETEKTKFLILYNLS